MMPGALTMGMPIKIFQPVTGTHMLKTSPFPIHCHAVVMYKFSLLFCVWRIVYKALVKLTLKNRGTFSIRFDQIVIC